MSSDDKPPRSGILASRWRRIALGFLVVMIGVRIALPYAARRLAVSQIDQALIGRAEIDDLDFALLRGRMAVHGLRVFAQEAPTPPAVSSGWIDTAIAQEAPSGSPAAEAPAANPTPAAANPDPAATNSAPAAASPAPDVRDANLPPTGASPPVPAATPSSR